MRKMKNYLKTRILLLGIPLLLLNCEKQEEITESLPVTQVKHITLIQLKNNEETKNIFNVISSNLDINKNNFGKGNNTNDNKITLLTDKILELKKNNITTYTFRIKEPTSKSSDFENLLIFKYYDNSFQLIIAKFKYTENKDNLPYTISYKKINVEDLNNFDYLNQSADLNQRADDMILDECIDVSYTCPSGGTTYHGPELCGNPPGSGPGSTTILDFSNCFGGGGSSSGNDGTSTGGDPGTGGDTGTVGGGGTGAVLPPPCDDPIHGCLNTPWMQLAIRLNITVQNQIDYLESNENLVSEIQNFIDLNNSIESKSFAKLAIEALTNNQYISFDEILYNRTELDNNITGDIDNNTTGGFDSTIYNTFNPTQETWPTINSVILLNDFIGWKANDPISQRNCMAYAKAQIAKKSYQISNYKNVNGQISDQTIQIFTEQNGVNQTELQKGLSYLKYALDNGIPVIVGVDAHSGSPNPNTDSTTDHFVVIVGMGTDNNGQYFIFYDNASGQTPYQNYGANPNNKFYYNSSTGTLTGRSQTRFSLRAPRIYTVTQIRKSKSL